MKPALILMLLIAGFQGFSQADTTRWDTAYDQPDSIVYYDDTVYTYNPATYTQKPGNLTVTQREAGKEYQPQKFSKTEWKRITGNTNYDEEPQKQVRGFSQMPSFEGNPFIIKVLPFLLIFGLIAFLIYLFIKQALKAPGNKIRQQQGALYSDQTVPEDLDTLNLDKLLQEALAKRNLRLAVRLYYIKLLQHFDREGFIRWERNKTNRDYARELGGLPVNREFRKLMNAYEYVWYGERTPSAEEFSVLESNFQNLFKTQRA